MLTREVARTQLDRRSMWRSLRGAVPGLAIERLGGAVGETLVCDHLLQRGEPMPVVALPGAGIAGGLPFLDFLAEGRRPILPGEDARLMQRDGHGEGTRLPRIANGRPLLIDGAAQDSWQGLPTVAHAGSR